MAVEIVAKLLLHVIGILVLICQLVIRIFYIIVPKKTFYKSLKNEVVLITGGGDGLGRCLALRLSCLGCRIVIWDINEDGLRQTRDLIVSDGGECHIFHCDVTDREKVYAMARRVKDEVGPVTVLVNNAGIVSGKYRLLDLPDHLIQKTFQVNVVSHFWTYKAFLPEMLSLKRGHVVSIASVVAWSGIVSLSDYSSSKAAANNLLESLSLELKADKHSYIHTTVVLPYHFNSRLFHGLNLIVPVMKCDDVADRIVDAILFNEDIVVVPDVLSFAHLPKCIFPWKIYCFLYKLFGGNTAMDAFIGRNQE